MTTIPMTAAKGAGVLLAERLGLKIIGKETCDVKTACVLCQSSDAGRVHQDSGLFHCYSCGKGLSGFDLAKVVLKDHKAAVRMMIDVGLFEDYMQPGRKGSGNGKPAPAATPATSPPPNSEDMLEAIARLKGCTKAGLVAFGAIGGRKSVAIPMFGPPTKEETWDPNKDGEGRKCSALYIGPSGGKGMNEGGKPTGLFLPGRAPAAGETWLLCEGPKDTSVLFDMGYLAAGLPGNTLAKRLAPAFAGVHVILVPDADIGGQTGAEKSAGVLKGIAASVKIASLPSAVKESDGEDVRDVLKRLGVDGPAAIKKAIDEAKPVGKDGEAEEPPDFINLVSSAEFLALDLKPRFLIRDIMVAGQQGVFGGRSKTLKTTIGEDAAISLGSGTPFLGKFSCDRVNVAFWSGESGAVTLRETAIRIAESKGIDLATCSVDWGFDLPKLSKRNHLDALVEVIQQRKLQVIFVDPLYLALLSADAAGRSSDLFFMGTILEPLSKIGRETGCTIQLLHHFRKNSPGDDAEPAALEELSQSGTAEWARQWILLARRSPYQADGCHELWMRAGGSAGHAGLYGLDVDEGTLDPDTFGGRKWEVSVKSITDTRDEIRREKESRRAAEAERREGEHVDRVLDALKLTSGGDTFRRLRTGTRLNQDNLDRVVRTLEHDGRIEACRVQTLRGVYDGWRIKE